MLFIEEYKNMKYHPKDAILINTTSRSNNWTQGLSPFIISAGHLYENYYAKNVENGYQACKVYKQFVDDDNNPTKEYFKWANKIWQSNYAFRYPMGKEAKPLYSYWDGEKLDYISARKKIYIPMYGNNLIKTNTFKKLLELYRTTDKDIYLYDFDGYNHIKIKKSFKDCLNDSTKNLDIHL